MNTQNQDKCTLWIRRSFGTDFTLYFNSPEQAWNSGMNLIKAVEHIENADATIFTNWDMSTGKIICKSTYLEKPDPPAQITKFWAAHLNSLEYPIAQGHSFQIFLLKGHGLINIPFHKNTKTLLMNELEAIEFLNENDEEITTVKSRNTVNVHRPLY